MSKSAGVLALEAEIAALPDADDAVSLTWKRLYRVVEARARRITSAPDEQDDLLQEALWELCKIGPSRYDRNDKDDMRYLARALKYRMIEVYASRPSRGRVGRSVEPASGGSDAGGGLSIERVDRQLRLVG